MQPKFLYFDLGKVLVNFSVDQMLRQIGAVAGVAAEEVRAAVFGNGLMRQHESGRLSDRQFYEAFCAATGRRPDYHALAATASEIFELSRPMLPLVAQLGQAGYRLGILSNTCSTHWEYCRRRYRIVAEGFEVYALSYRIGAVKPEAAIFRAAAESGRRGAGRDLLRRRHCRTRGRGAGGGVRRRAIHHDSGVSGRVARPGSCGSTIEAAMQRSGM